MAQAGDPRFTLVDVHALNQQGATPMALRDDDFLRQKVDQIAANFAATVGDVPQQQYAGGNQQQPAPNNGGGNAGGGGAGGGMMQFDTDGDGKISQAEAPSFLADRFGDMDKNSDGFIDQAEVDAAMSAYRGGGGQ